MANTIHVELEALPWRPAEDVDEVVVLHHYDMPLVGVIRQHGVEYLFQCVAGEIEPVSLWAYTRIDPDERELLEAVTDPDELRARIHDLGLVRNGVLAFAIEGIGIAARIEVDGAIGEALGSDAIEQLVAQAEDRLKRIQERLPEVRELARSVT